MAVAISTLQMPLKTFSGMIVSIAIIILSGVDYTNLLKRIKNIMLLLSPMIVILILTAGGKELYRIAGVAVYSGGIILAGTIIMKTISVILLLTAATGHFRTGEIIAALKSLNLPEKLLILFVLTHRYFCIYSGDLRRMFNSMNLRGFKKRNGLFHWRSGAGVTGSLLVRSYDQMERVYSAMVLRGYSGDLKSHYYFKSRPVDWVLSGFAAILSLIMIIL